MFAHIDAQTQSVENNDDGKNERDCKTCGRKSVDERNGGDKREDKSGVRAWHMSVGNRIANIPAVLSAVIRELDCFGQNADQHRNEKDENALADHSA
ncbi:MAG: hypothetical protein IPL87_05230 [Candidatus Moraniibacteriota bacterium]|nr:MAG: hypothetical protein IPL87_05230 [Candidatus Moranbacteria bacterium]